MLPSLDVDQDFFRLVGLKWKYPPLAHDNLGTGNKVVLNELAVEKLHLPSNPVGSYIKSWYKNHRWPALLKISTLALLKILFSLSAFGCFPIPLNSGKPRGDVTFLPK